MTVSPSMDFGRGQRSRHQQSGLPMVEMKEFVTLGRQPSSRMLPVRCPVGRRIPNQPS